MFYSFDASPLRIEHSHSLTEIFSDWPMADLDVSFLGEEIEEELEQEHL